VIEFGQLCGPRLPVPTNVTSLWSPWRLPFGKGQCARNASGGFLGGGLRIGNDDNCGFHDFDWLIDFPVVRFSGVPPPDRPSLELSTGK